MSAVESGVGDGAVGEGFCLDADPRSARPLAVGVTSLAVGVTLLAVGVTLLEAGDTAAGAPKEGRELLLMRAGSSRARFKAATDAAVGVVAGRVGITAGRAEV